MIRQILAEGPAVASKVIKMVTDGAGCSETTVREAARKLGVLTTRQQNDKGKTTGWLWQNPQVDTSASGSTWKPEAPEAEVMWHEDSQ